MTETQHQHTHKCDVCGKAFEAESGRNKHQGQMHSSIPAMRDLEKTYGVPESTEIPKHEREGRAINALGEIIADDVWEHVEMRYFPLWWGEIPAICFEREVRDLNYAEKLFHHSICDLIGMTENEIFGTGTRSVLIPLREEAQSVFRSELEFGDEPDPRLGGESVPAETILGLTFHYYDTHGQGDAYEYLRSIPDEKKFRSGPLSKTPRADVV